MASAQTTCPKNTLRKTTSREAAIVRREWVLSRNIETKQRQNYSKGLKGSQRRCRLAAGGRLQLSVFYEVVKQVLIR